VTLCTVPRATRSLQSRAERHQGAVQGRAPLRTSQIRRLEQ